MQNSLSRVSTQSKAVVIILTIAVVLLFLAGFVMGEDAGGARYDFYRYHLPIILSFRMEPWAIAVRDYPSATGPLFHIIESLNPLLGHDTAFRTFNVLVALGIFVLFVLALKVRFKSFAPDTTCPWLVGTFLLLSPYFRGSSYWPTTDNLSLVFTVLVCLLLQPLLEGDTIGESSWQTVVRIALIAIFSMAAFYTRQLYFWLPVFAFVILIIEAARYRLWTIAVYTISGLPALYLFHVWNGFAPPTFQHRHQGISPAALVILFAMITFYALPFFLETLSRGEWIFPPKADHSRLWWSGAIILCLLFVAPAQWFPLGEYASEGGIVGRVFAHFGHLGPFLILAFAGMGVILLIVFVCESSWKSWLLIGMFLVPNLINKVAFERYFDPLILVTFFLFFDRRVVTRFSTCRAAVFLMLFYSLLLSGSIVYHGGGGRAFHPIYEQQKPWADIPAPPKW